MTHDFVVNTENVNEYKYRVLTSGIDYRQYLRNPVVLYIHTRENQEEEIRGSEVVGRCIALTVKGTELIATIEFDEEDPFAKKIAGKVQRGFVRMTSIYADVIETPDEPAKAEIRIFYFWKDGEARPIATQNLARMSKGKMIGVRYNKDREWVGGSLVFFEK